MIVNAGGWGDLSAERGSYDSYVEHLSRICANVDRDGVFCKLAHVHVVQSVGEALEKLSGRAVQVLVLVTRGMLGEARRIKLQHPKIRMVVFTSDVPDDEVLIADKTLGLTIEQLRRVILGA